MARLRVRPLRLRLRLRLTPAIAEGNIVTTLPLATEVEAADEPEGRFSEVEALLPGGVRKGFVATRHLRPPESDAKERLLEACVAEWLRFDDGRGREHEPPYADYVGEMWEALGFDFDGRDRDVPWSAAFVSFVMRRAGYDDFRFSLRHADYIVDGIRRREAGDESAPFWGFRLSEQRPRLGDLVCMWRKQAITYAQAVPRERFPSHCDVVVDVKPASIKTLGGNVGQSVRPKTFSRNDRGFLKARSRLFALLANRH